MKRLDVALVEWGLAPSRSKAQQMIDAGEVEVLRGGQWTAPQASTTVQTKNDVRVLVGETLKYVSRGGLKLEGALGQLGLDVAGLRVFDVGLSTGGFSDCLLQKGASAILGIDVGHDQLHPSLKGDARLISLEGVHVKDLATQAQVQAWLALGVDLCVVDVSFISLENVLPVLSSVLPKGCALLALVKPQFEVGQGALNKKGIADPEAYEDVRRRVLLSLEKCGFSLKEYLSSQVKGQDGNQEFFAYAHRT